MYSFSNKRDRTQLAVGVSKPYTYILGGEYEKRDMLFEEMYRAGMLKEVHPDAQDFFVLTQEEQYKEDTGLKLEVELGVILFA